MQEHEYKARDKTVQKMSRDGLREENLRNKEEKRITGRDMDTEVSRSEKKDELDFSKRRREHSNGKRETEHSEKSSPKARYSRETVLDEKSEQDIDGELDGEQVADESTAARNPHFAVRASVDSQGENGLIWKRLQTAGISVEKDGQRLCVKRKTEGKGGVRRKQDGKERSCPVQGNFRSGRRVSGWIFGGDQRQIEAGTCAERTAEKEFQIIV